MDNSEDRKPAHPAPSQPSAEALVQAALEAAAKSIEDMSRPKAGHSGFTSQPVRAATYNYLNAIRALSAQQIIESCKEKS